MLVIFDDQNRTSGVKEYLKDGEKISSSKYVNKQISGLSEYLNKGKTGDRDIKDLRIPLYGDLDIFDEITKIGTSKGASESYRNFVISFEEDNVSTKHMGEIVNSFLDTYMTGYYKDEFTAYAECHKLKVKYKIDENGNKIKRHLHIHISIAKYSSKLNRLLDMGHHGEFVKTGGRRKELELWKGMIEKKYNLKSCESKAISTDSFKNKTLQETREGLKRFCENKVKDLNTLDELIIELKKFDFIDSIKKSKNAKTPYISVKLDNGKSIRLKGTLFNDMTFSHAKEKINLVEGQTFYRESTNPIDIEIPAELERLQKARADKVSKDLKKVRLQHNDLLSELKPISTSEELFKSKEFENNEIVSPLTYKVTDIKSKQKNKVNLEFYNQKIDARVLLSILNESHNINEKIYHPYITRNGMFIEVGTHKYTLSQFLQKEMNFSWDELVKTLYYTYKYQQQFKNNDHFANKNQVNIYEQMSYQNKKFIDIYKQHSNLDLSGFYISNQNDITILKKQDIKIEDTGDTLQTLSNNQKTKEKVSIMLELAKAKGWDTNDLKIDGTDEFIKEANRQIFELKNEENIEKNETKSNKKRRNR